MRRKRKYQPIWETIRDSADGTCTITAPSAIHRRIIKGVLKEKCELDPGFTVLAGERWKWNKLNITIKGSVIIFKLTHSLDSLEDIASDSSPDSSIPDSLDSCEGSFDSVRMEHFFNEKKKGK